MLHSIGGGLFRQPVTHEVLCGQLAHEVLPLDPRGSPAQPVIRVPVYSMLTYRGLPTSRTFIRSTWELTQPPLGSAVPSQSRPSSLVSTWVTLSSLYFREDSRALPVGGFVALNLSISISSFEVGSLMYYRH